MSSVLRGRPGLLKKLMIEVHQNAHIVVGKLKSRFDCVWLESAVITSKLVQLAKRIIFAWYLLRWSSFRNQINFRNSFQSPLFSAQWVYYMMKDERLIVNVHSFLIMICMIKGCVYTLSRYFRNRILYFSFKPIVLYTKPRKTMTASGHFENTF